MSTDTSRHQDQKGRSAVRRKGDHLTADRETVMSADTQFSRWVELEASKFRESVRHRGR